MNNNDWQVSLRMTLASEVGCHRRYLCSTVNNIKNDGHSSCCGGFAWFLPDIGDHSSCILLNKLFDVLQNQNHVPLVVMYHPALPMLQRTIKCYDHILQDSERVRNVIPSLPIRAFHRQRNLHDLLVCSPVFPGINDDSGNFSCGAEGCMTCPILVTTDMFVSKTTGKSF